MYLRKSRMDKDYTEATVEDTLKRHEKILEEFAEKNGYNIAKIYKEVISGESISARPEIQKVLEDVSTGSYYGVLVMDIDRLSRGSSIDAGYIQQVFKYSGCKIITPAKTYDLSDETDEQFSDLSFMMSRYEYRVINKRLIRGRKVSASEGRYMGSVAPYGYSIKKIQGDKGNTLEIVEPEAEIVRKIFDAYVNGGLGYNSIAKQLNGLGLRTRTGVRWSVPIIRQVLQNPVYCGKIRYGRKCIIKSVVGDKIVKSRKYLHNFDVYDGLHEAIIPSELFEQMWEVRAGNDKTPVRDEYKIRNPLAGLIYCAKCGKKMRRVVYTGKHTDASRERLVCLTENCGQPSSPLKAVEAQVLHTLKNWLDNFKISVDGACISNPLIDNAKTAIEEIDAQIGKIKSQLTNAYSYLEQGVYTVDIFRARAEALNSAIAELTNRREQSEAYLHDARNQKTIQDSILPKTAYLVNSYDNLSVDERRAIYRDIIRRIEYNKDPVTKQFALNIFPVI